MTPLDQSAAVAWLSARGVEADTDTSFRLVADESVLSGVVARRLWHSASTLRRGPSDPRATLLLIPLEGRIGVSSGTAPGEPVDPGRFAVVPRGQHTAITTAAPSARLEILARRAPGPSGLPLIASSRALPTLIATVNAVLDSHPDPDGPSAPGLASALESLVAAVLLSAE